MKKKIMILSLCTLLVCSCGKIPKLENGQEAIVTFENGNKISVEDLYNDLKNNYALEALISLVDKKILEDKYKDRIDSATDYANTTMKSLEENYKDDLLNAIQTYTSFTTIEAYKNYVYINYLQNEAIEEYAKSQVSEKEMKEYYEKNIYGDVLVNHILVTPKVKEDATTEEKTAAEEEAKEKVKTIIAKLKESDNKKETFTSLAKEYSEDTSTKDEGGSLGYINNGTLPSSYDELMKSAFALKNGEFSTEIITTQLGYHVIFREDSKEKVKFEEVESTIRETLGTKLLSEDKAISIKALQNLRKEYGMEIVDSEVQKQYANYIQNALLASDKTTN